ncbi:MAG: hypothetical protein Q8908_02345 [Bacteroidota bacterium]|nr:hypothetical protein [Bacteroidota bacterium]
MIRSIKILLLLFAVFFSITVTAQQNQSGVKAAVKADTIRRLIGQQVVLTINVQAPKAQKILWPVIPDSIGKLEVISRTPIDTTRGAEKGWKSYSQKLTVTSFDTGYITFPKLPFRTGSGKDTASVLSDSVLLKYTGVAIDTTKSIKDIKGIMRAPLTASEIMPWLLGIMILGAIAVIAYTVYLRKKSKKPFILFKPKPDLLPHEVALEALNHLKNEAIWKNGRFKEYYTGLTDILRTYLDKRYGVNAQEMTSDEIMEAMNGQTTDGLMGRLKELFFTADMVKFAKGIPEPHENETNLDTAYDFVENTKLVPAVIPPVVDTTKTNVTTTNTLTK